MAFVVSDTHAKVYIKAFGVFLWVHSVKDSPSAISLGKTMQRFWLFLVRDRHEKLPVCQKRSESDRLQHREFRTHGCSYQAEGSTILNSRQPREILCSEKKRSAGSVWRPVSEGSEVRDASFFNSDIRRVTISMKLLMGNFFRLSPMRGERFWQEIPRERKVSSVPNQEETTILFIDYPKCTNLWNLYEDKTTWARCSIKPNKRADRTAFSTQFCRWSYSDREVYPNTFESCKMISRIRMQSYPMENKRNIGNIVLFPKISFSVTGAGKYSQGTIQKSLSKVVEVHNGTMTQAPYIAQKRTEWQKEPSAEWQKEHCRTSVKIGLPEQYGIVQRNALVICATGAIKMIDDKTAFEERDDNILTDPRFFFEHWLSTSQAQRKTSRAFISLERKRWRKILKLCATCARRFVRLFHDSRSWRFARIKSFRHLCQKIQKPRLIRKRRIRNSVFKRNFKTFRSCTTVIDSRGTLPATTWCWNRRWRQKGKQHRRFVVHKGRIFPTPWKTSIEALRPRLWNILDPIDIRQCNETNSGQYKQVMWNYSQWRLGRSKGCQSFWRCFGTRRFQILRARLLEVN